MRKDLLSLFYIFILFIACKKTELIRLEKEDEYVDLKIEDILISEILPDPKKDGVEFVEIYNNSTRLIDLSALQLATTNSTGKRSKLHPISNISTYLYPFTYKLLSLDSKAVQSHYPFQDQNTFHEMSSFPTLTNSQGAVLLFREEQLIDSLFYSVGMHDVFIKNSKGVSLERVSFNKPTNRKDNFISSAASTGYGTPGYENSQLENQDAPSQLISLSSKTFAPNQGEQLKIDLHFAKGGKMANLVIYNGSGKRVRNLLKSHRLGVKNSITWNGKDDNNMHLSTGIYHLFIELYDSKGNRNTYKKSCVLTSKVTI